jgi:hypothetical protein
MVSSHGKSAQGALAARARTLRSLRAPPPPLATAPNLGYARGHRLGVMLAVPAITCGLLAGLRNGTFRYLGFTANGNPSMYPGYKEDQTPYFVKHNVSTRYVPPPRQKEIE